MTFAGVGVHAPSGRPMRVKAALRLSVGGTILLLGLPAVAHLLVSVLEGRVGNPVGPLLVPVLLSGGVVGLGVGTLGLGIGFLQGTGQFIRLGLASALGLGNNSDPGS